MNSQFLISGTGVSMELQWFGDKDSFNQELQNSGILSFPGYKVPSALCPSTQSRSETSGML